MNKWCKKITYFMALILIFSLIMPANIYFAKEEKVDVIVVYKDEVPKKKFNMSLSKLAENEEVLDDLGIKIMSVPKSEVEKIKANPNVETVALDDNIHLYEQNFMLSANVNRPKDEQLFNLELLNIYEAWDSGYTGEGVKVAVIDGGFEKHSDLKLAGGYSFIDGKDYTVDEDGHGTHVAGTIGALRNGVGMAGVAPDSQIYGLKVFDGDDGKVSDLIKALDWSIEKDMDIVNMSLGLYWDNSALREAIKRAFEKGLILVAASGNDDGAPVSYPAAYDEVIAVASINQNKIRSSFSNKGDQNELAAPGENIYSTYLWNSYKSFNGTSMATPHVTGLLAVLKERFPNYSPSTLRKYITETAEDLGDVGRDILYGYGLARYIAPTTSNIVVSNIRVVNNYGKQDVITFNNLRVGNIYSIYKDANLQNKITSFTAKSNTESIVVSQLGYTSGSLYITEQKTGYGESIPIKVNYKAEQLPSILAKNVTVINYYNANDQITLKGLTKGFTYTIYSNKELTKKLASFTESGSTGTISVKQVGPKAGAIYVVVGKNGYLSSSPTKVAFSNEKIVALSAKNVSIKNNKKSDTISFKGLMKGFTYTVYTDSSLKKKLTSFTASGTTKTVTVKQVGAKAGSVYIVISKSGLISSSATKVSFNGEPTPAIPAKNVKVSNKKTVDTITFKGLKKGTTVVIYSDAKKKKKITSFKATSSTKTVKVKQLGKKAGKIYITAQAPGYSVSTLTAVSYSKER